MFRSIIHFKNFDDEDTRTFLYNELFADMNTRDLILGRGFQGNYFSPYFLWQQTRNHDFSGDFSYRFSVEVGFLECLLKGGFVFFFLYITPLVSACYRGLFSRHNNRVVFLIATYPVRAPDPVRREYPFLSFSVLFDLLPGGLLLQRGDPPPNTCK